MPGLVLNLIGDPSDLLRAFRRSSEGADRFGRDLKQLGLTAEQSSRKQVEASVHRERRVRSEIESYRQLASAAKRGSAEQVHASRLAAEAEARLARQVGTTTRAQQRQSRVGRDLGRDLRGGVAGSGALGGLGGRALAFGSFSFLGGFGLSRGIRASIDAATEAAATERQLRAQFKASGRDLADYKERIDAATLAESRLSGFTQDELTQSFTTAFRGSRNVTSALKLQAVAADVARGRHIPLAAATIALTKAYGGQTTALRRLGIQVPKNLTGMEAIEFVQRRFAGQARAGSTAQQRFSAALHNTQVTIGTALLPSVTRYLNRGAAWLGQAKNQRRIQHDVNMVMKTGAGIVRGLGTAIHIADRVTGSFKHTMETLLALGIASKVLKIAQAFKTLAIWEGAAAGGGAAGAAGGFGKVAAGAFGAGAAGTAVRVGLGGVAVGAGVSAVGDKRAGGKGEVAIFGRHKVGDRVGDYVVTSIRGGVAFGKRRNAPPGVQGPVGTSSSAGGVPPGIQGPVETQPGPRRPLSLQGRFNLLELRLAGAELTATKRDDRAVLVAQAAVVRQMEARSKNLADKTALRQQLAGIEGQIADIDADAARAEKDAADKRKQAAKALERAAKARQREAAARVRAQIRLEALGLREQAQALSFEKQAATRERTQLKERQRTLRERIKTIQDSFKSAVDTAREGIGELFAGPVLQPGDNRRILGLPTPGSDPRALVKDLQGQVQAFSAFQTSLARLSRRGAPKALIRELRAQGLTAAPEATALAGAGQGTLRSFFQAFKGRERLAITTARADMRAQLVTLHATKLQLATVTRQEIHVEVDIKGIERSQRTVKVKQSALQRRGQRR